MRKSVSQDLSKSHQLLLRTGMICQIGSGLFSWLPLGMRVLNRVHTIVGLYHKEIGFNECCVPIVQPANLWMLSGRYNAYGEEMMRLKDRHENELVLGPTAEEVFVEIVKQNTNSYKDFPINIYNIQWKYRDEIRPRFGLMRAREFLMCDAYSFHLTLDEAEQIYNKALVGYTEMFNALGFKPIPLQQNDTGEIGGTLSHEFFAISGTGENEITFEEKWINNSVSNKLITSRAIELGHIFLLGTKYSESMGLCVDVSGKKCYPQMGCYGTGVSRLVGAYAEIFGGQNGIEWPESVAPFQVHVIGNSSDKSIEFCKKLHNIWPDEIYYDDRNTSFGEKMAVADLIGAPVRVIAADREVEANKIKVNNVLYTLDQTVHLLGEKNRSRKYNFN